MNQLITQTRDLAFDYLPGWKSSFGGDILKFAACNFGSDDLASSIKGIDEKVSSIFEKATFGYWASKIFQKCAPYDRWLGGKTKDVIKDSVRRAALSANGSDRISRFLVANPREGEEDLIKQYFRSFWEEQKTDILSSLGEVSVVRRAQNAAGVIQGLWASGKIVVRKAGFLSRCVSRISGAAGLALQAGQRISGRSFQPQIDWTTNLRESCNGLSDGTRALHEGAVSTEGKLDEVRERVFEFAMSKLDEHALSIFNGITDLIIPSIEEALVEKTNHFVLKVAFVNVVGSFCVDKLLSLLSIGPLELPFSALRVVNKVSSVIKAFSPMLLTAGYKLLSSFSESTARRILPKKSNDLYLEYTEMSHALANIKRKKSPLLNVLTNIISNTVDAARLPSQCLKGVTKNCVINIVLTKLITMSSDLNQVGDQSNSQPGYFSRIKQMFNRDEMKRAVFNKMMIHLGAHQDVDAAAGF